MKLKSFKQRLTDNYRYLYYNHKGGIPFLFLYHEQFLAADQPHSTNHPPSEDTNQLDHSNFFLLVEVANASSNLKRSPAAGLPRNIQQKFFLHILTSFL